MADELHGPLGEGRPPAPTGRRSARRALLVGATVCVLLGGGVWALRLSKPSSPSGVTVARIEPAPPPPAAPAPVQASAPAQDTGDASGVTVVRPPGTVAPAPAFIKVPQELTVSLQPAPDPKLVEKTRFGLLPRRGADGTRPADIYARPLITSAKVPATAPRIALVVGGMGLNSALTSRATTDLPPDVTFAFAPYGDDLDHQVRAAREAGHEVVLQVPMEGFGDAPATDTSHLLMSGLEGRELLDRLHWHMGRFTGYVALSGFMGGKFTADDAGLMPVLRDVGSRGLFYVDDGTSARSRVAALASPLALPLVRADVLIDASPDPAAIDAALRRLESRARDRGVAVGFANGLPASISRMAAFAKKLEDHGLALVPVSALAALQSGTADKIARP